MKGIYTRERKGGTAVYISYTPPREGRVREVVEFVTDGPAFSKRLREAEKRAEKVLIKRRAAIVEDRHELVRPKKASHTFATFVEKVYADELRDSGIRSAPKEIRRITIGAVGCYFGALQLSELNEWNLRKYIKARRDDGAGPAVINRDLARISHLWNRAAKQKLVSGLNPVREVGRLKEPRGRVRYLTHEEEASLLAELPRDVRPIAEVALHTGIRRGALLGLRWRHVDFTTLMIEVTEELDKTGHGYYVAINARVREVLGDVSTRAAFTGRDDFVFCLPDGSQRMGVRDAFEKARERAGLEDFRWHDFRHTAASRIVQAGGTLLDAGEHLGHRTLLMTQRYAHLSPERRQKVADLTISGRSAGGDVIELGDAQARR